MSMHFLGTEVFLSHKQMQLGTAVISLLERIVVAIGMLKTIINLDDSNKRQKHWSWCPKKLETAFL